MDRKVVNWIVFYARHCIGSETEVTKRETSDEIMNRAWEILRPAVRLITEPTSQDELNVRDNQMQSTCLHVLMKYTTANSFVNTINCNLQLQ